MASGKEYQAQTLVFLISRVWVRVPIVTPVSLSKTLNHDAFNIRMGHKALGTVCCVLQVKEPSALIEKRMVHTAPQHLVNPYIVL